jgi:predicted helicase
VKFIRFAQYCIDKNGFGVFALITNNSFLDGVIFRKMRESLLSSFDKVYIIDLHGNSKKKEQNPEGGIDKNIFDIMQGVSVSIYIKNNQKEKKDYGKMLSFDLYGTREYKYNFLNTNSLESINWKRLDFNTNSFFFVEKIFNDEDKYKNGFSTNELFIVGSSGIKTERDSLAIQFSKNELKVKIDELKASEV